jgi:hypothetical protein
MVNLDGSGPHRKQQNQIAPSLAQWRPIIRAMNSLPRLGPGVLP